jgi:hypothetical protein
MNARRDHDGTVTGDVVERKPAILASSRMEEA